MLGRLGPDAKFAVPSLTAALDNEDLRCQAAAALLEISGDNPRALRILIESTEDEYPSNRLQAIRSFRRLKIKKVKEKDVIAILEGALKDDDGVIRIVAAGALLQLKPKSKKGLKAFLEVFKDTDSGDSNELGDEVWDTFVDYDGYYEGEWDEVLETLESVSDCANAAIPIIVKDFDDLLPKSAEASVACGPWPARILVKMRKTGQGVCFLL